MTRSGTRSANGTGRSTVRAAGALVWRENDGRLEVALVHRPRYKDWSWPKGKLEPGEPSPAAAVREVAEEIGEQIVLGLPLPDQRYRLADGRPKRVEYWAAQVASRTGPHVPALVAREPVERAPRSEVDDVVWVGTGTAAELLTRESDVEPLSVLVDRWSRDRLRTAATVLVRHGRAKSRSSWDGGEETRPLTSSGRAQARAMVPLLAAFGVREIVTSPWARCLDTVAPYAASAGLDPVLAPVLTETAHRADGEAATALLADHVGDPRDAVVAMHRPVLPAAVQVLGAATRRWTTGTLPDADPYLRPGELLVAHVTTAPGRRRPRLAAVETHRSGS